MKDNIKNILISLADFTKKILSDTKLFLLVILSIVSICLYFNLRSTRNDYENVIRHQSDSLADYKNKVGEIYKEIDGYITDINTLKEENAELYTEVKNLKDNPIIVTKVKTEVVIKEKILIDTVELIEGKKDVYKINQSYTDDYISLKMHTIFDYNTLSSVTTLKSVNIPSTFTLNLIESKKGDLSFLVKSNNPYVEINNVNGIMLSPEDSKAIKKRYDKRWCVVVGVGPTFTVVDSKFKVYGGLQITFGYKIFSF